MSINVSPTFTVVTRVAGAAFADPDEISLRQVREIVAGKAGGIPRSRAMALLQESDFPIKHRDFERVLAAEHEPAEMRHLAALHLGMIDAPAAVEILVDHSDIPDDFVLSGVMKALGRIGNESALEAVERVQRRPKGGAAVHADFAAVLITHRLGLDGHDVPVPEENEYVKVLAREARSVRVSTADAVNSEICLRSLAYQPFGIEFAEHPIHEVRCGTNIWMILFNRDVVDRDGFGTIVERKTFLGVVARRNNEDGLYTAAFVVLTAPSAQTTGVDILIHRTSGRLAIAGQARFDGRRANFFVRSLAKPRGFDVQMEGILEEGRLNLESALVTSRGEKMRPIEDQRPDALRHR